MPPGPRCGMEDLPVPDRTSADCPEPCDTCGKGVTFSPGGLYNDCKEINGRRILIVGLNDGNGLKDGKTFEGESRAACTQRFKQAVLAGCGSWRFGILLEAIAEALGIHADLADMLDKVNFCNIISCTPKAGGSEKHVSQKMKDGCLARIGCGKHELNLYLNLDPTLVILVGRKVEGLWPRVQCLLTITGTRAIEVPHPSLQNINLHMKGRNKEERDQSYKRTVKQEITAGLQSDT